jgi:hypothetical protein
MNAIPIASRSITTINISPSTINNLPNNNGNSNYFQNHQNAMPKRPSYKGGGTAAEQNAVETGGGSAKRKNKTLGGSLKGSVKSTLAETKISVMSPSSRKLILLHLPFQQHSKLHVKSGITARQAISAILKVF